MSEQPSAGGADSPSRVGPRSVGIVVVSHSATLAAGVVELAREMAGPDVRIAAVGGLPLPDTPLGTDAESIKRGIEQVNSDDGVLILMDLGSALLSAELAVELLPSEWRHHVVLCDAPLVEGAIAAAVQARLGSPLDRVFAEARAALTPKVEHLQPDPESGAPSSQAGTERPMLSARPNLPEQPREPAREMRLVVRNRLGIHARPAARLVQTAARFQAEIHLTNSTTGRPSASARSITQISSLEALAGHEILISATGPDADAALEAIRALVDSGFGEPTTDQLTTSFAPSSADVGPAMTAPTATGTHTSNPRPRQDALAPGSELRGLAASPGIAQGKAHRVVVDLPRTTAKPSDPATEWQRLVGALAKVRARIQTDGAAMARRGDDDSAAILEAQALLLDDPALVEPARRQIFDERLDAATAWQRASDAVVGQYRSLHDEYLRARAADVADVARQVVTALNGDEDIPSPAFDQPCILVADDLGPGDVVRLDRSRVLGICTALGGPTSHVAIIARTLGIPAVVGLGPAILAVADGTPLAVDGESGRVLVNPDRDALPRLVGTAAPIASSTAASPAERASPAMTRDGHRVVILANVGTLSDARAAIGAGAEGVGLFRTEFLFLNRQAAPDEAEQLAAYKSVAEALEGKPLVIRTLDAGGDKPLPYLNLLAETNPFLGQRAIRLCLARPALFATQLRAIVRLAATHPVKVMFPMIATTDELRAARDLLAAARAEVERSGQAVSVQVEVGMMVETPAAALQVDRFCDVVDFFSIGTNDLAQYTAAADRGNARVASLADPFHPAVLRLIRRVADAAQARGKPVAVCGEMAGDPLGAPLLIGLGIDELSMSPSAIPHIREVIRALDYRSARTVAREALDRANASEVRKLIADVLRSSRPPEAR